MALSDPATRRRIILVVSVMALAFSAGHIMQNVLARDANLAVRGLAPDVAPVVREGAKSLPLPPAATLTPFIAPDLGPTNRITDDPPLPELPLEDASSIPLGAPCRTSVDAVAGDAGMIWLEISAPCLPDQKVTVSHEGIDVDWTLDARGRLSVDLPAFSVAPRVIVRFADGTDDNAVIAMPNVTTLFRAALAWNGPQVLGLHALEAGAVFGGQGHTHSGAAGQVTAENAEGYLVRLGDGSGAMAEVYTLPRGRADGLRLSADAEVTSATCDKRTTVSGLQMDALGGTVVRVVTLSMPTCDALGDIVSLGTLFQPVQLAFR